jgi:pimeloyl-ACP methyl ester carboxylesterase
LHGNPLTHVSWHKVADRLAKYFLVVATGLRGYGDSVRPEDGGENHINYWKGFGEVVAGRPNGCGHSVPEEPPDETYAWFMRFF